MHLCMTLLKPANFKGFFSGGHVQYAHAGVMRVVGDAINGEALYKYHLCTHSLLN